MLLTTYLFINLCMVILTESDFWFTAILKLLHSMSKHLHTIEIDNYLNSSFVNKNLYMISLLQRSTIILMKYDRIWYTMILYAIWSDKDCIFKQQQFLNSNINCNWFGTIWTWGSLHLCMLNARLCGSQVVATSTVVA